jgi:glycerophosphoryl diester phosphodiesterase
VSQPQTGKEMNRFDIIAHRGVHDELPENTLAAFQRAIELGADAVELDVRLTSDRVPIVFHYFYLDTITSISGAVFSYSFEQLKNEHVLSKNGNGADRFRISTLTEVLETIGGQIGLEIEIKGPEPESSQIVADVLCKFKHLWKTIEITSYEPMLLFDIQQQCPGLSTDLLFPRSEDWMKSDVVTYLAIHRGRLARARAVHLHPSQLSSEGVSAIQRHGIQVHAWDVNDEQSLKIATELKIPRICTDKFQQALSFRQRML